VGRLTGRKHSGDALSNILQDEKVYEFIDSKKEELRKVFAFLVNAFEQLFPDTPLKLEVIATLMWDVIKYENRILNVYILHDFGLENWGTYGRQNIVSERIIDEVFQVLEVDVGDIKLKKPTQKLIT
jgi:hypothetical protein